MFKIRPLFLSLIFCFAGSAVSLPAQPATVEHFVGSEGGAGTRDGRGVAQLLSYQVADDLASGKLVRLLQAWEAPPLPVHLVTKGRAHRAPKIDAFVDFAAQRLKTLPVLIG